eukprot:TRINITY_DN528_c0_g1_i5.p1 TRINITY_DN528_c0_g1~~TRINITY_DN528_c0_g1_i5.p1  ORF type:complete len:115 (+),score=24.53 TRINITY_DN528_c0_g1_i5:149-493(+)
MSTRTTEGSRKWGKGEEEEKVERGFGQGRGRGSQYRIIRFHASSSSCLKYSPASAWCRTTMAFGSSFLHSAVDFAANPKPRGMSAMEKTTTPWQEEKTPKQTGRRGQADGRKNG